MVLAVDRRGHGVAQAGGGHADQHIATDQALRRHRAAQHIQIGDPLDVAGRAGIAHQEALLAQPGRPTGHRHLLVLHGHRQARRRCLATDAQQRQRHVRQRGRRRPGAQEGMTHHPVGIDRSLGRAQAHAGRQTGDRRQQLRGLAGSGDHPVHRHHHRRGRRELTRQQRILCRIGVGLAEGHVQADRPGPGRGQTGQQRAVHRTRPGPAPDGRHAGIVDRDDDDAFGHRAAPEGQADVVDQPVGAPGPAAQRQRKGQRGQHHRDADARGPARPHGRTVHGEISTEPPSAPPTQRC